MLPSTDSFEAHLADCEVAVLSGLLTQASGVAADLKLSSSKVEPAFGRKWVHSSRLRAALRGSVLASGVMAISFFALRQQRRGISWQKRADNSAASGTLGSSTLNHQQPNWILDRRQKLEMTPSPDRRLTQVATRQVQRTGNA